MKQHTLCRRSCVRFRWSSTALCAWLLLSNAGLARASGAASTSEAGYSSVRVGALDPWAWSGIVMLAEFSDEPAYYGVRFGSIVDRTNAPDGRTFLQPADIYPNVTEVGPHAPDASYCRMSWKQAPRHTPITLEWSRIDETTIVGRLTTASDYILVAEAYFPFSGFVRGSQGYYFATDSGRGLRGERYFENEFSRASRIRFTVEAPVESAAVFPTPSALEGVVQGTGQALSAERSGAFGAVVFRPGSDNRARFVLALGWEDDELTDRTRRLLRDRTIDQLLERKASEYAAKRPAITGHYQGAAEAVGNNMFWNSLYVESRDRVFPSLSRAWAVRLGGWVLGEWDAFFGSLMTALEDRDQTFAIIRTIMESQTPRGVVPNIICGLGTSPDRSEPPIGAYCTWKVYRRYPDRAFLEWIYPRLAKWHRWWFTNRGDGQPWRDGNRNGLLEWGSDKGSERSYGGRGDHLTARWESGMDDSPIYDDFAYNEKTYTLEFDEVGLNCMYALDAESLAHLADILDQPEDAREFRRDYERMKARINELLWNDAAGMYQNRGWDGKFSPRLSPMNFYPLLSGVATPERANRMIQEHLRNEKEFWGEFVIPSAPRNDPAFTDGYYWRGNIWGPTNYLVYQGIKRYEFDDTAADYAEKSYNLYMGPWRQFNHNYENYTATGGTGGGDAHYYWGALLSLIAAEEYIDQNPWEGLRFGMLKAKTDGESSRMQWGPHQYTVAVGPRRTVLTRDGTERFRANRPVVVRSYQRNQGSEGKRLSFKTHGLQASRITLSEWDRGLLEISIDTVDSVDSAAPVRVAVMEGTASFDLAKGKHQVRVVHSLEP